MADTAPGLTDADIERLLQEAEARLSAKGQSSDASALTAPSTKEVLKQDSSSSGGLAAAASAGERSKDPSEELSIRTVKAKVAKKEYEQVRTDKGSDQPPSTPLGDEDQIPFCLKWQTGNRYGAHCCARMIDLS